MESTENAFDKVELPDEANGSPFDPTMAQAIEEASQWIGKGIEGVGEGRTDDGKPCIVVFVSRGGIQLEDRLPDTIRGFAVIISGTEEFHALSE